MKNKITFFQGRPEQGYVELVGLAADHRDIIQCERTDALLFKVEAPLFVAKEHMCLPRWVCSELNKYHANSETKFYEPRLYREKSTLTAINPVLQDKVQSGRFRVYRSTKALRIHHERSLRLYKHMVEADICRAQAMAALPQNVYVEYYAAADLTGVLDFTDMAIDHAVLPELRDIAHAVLVLMKEFFPRTMEKRLSMSKKEKIYNENNIQEG